MDVKIEQSWKERLAPEFEKDYFKELINFVKQEYSHGTVYPPGPYIFNAFEHCPFDKVKVVILGQDPYHEPGQAHGLCFSVQDGTPYPPSLINIFKEIESDLGTPMPKSGNLLRWADQGVLLLNATLTVRAHQGRFAPEPGMGSIYRCGNPQTDRRAQPHCLYTVGFICTAQRCFYRCFAQYDTQISASFPPLRLPRILREQAFQ